jgi:hypothetical protein
MRLRSIDFPVVCPDRSAAFQQLISNDIRNFAPRQLTDELDYGKCKTLCSRFKLVFQFDPSSIRNSQSAIRNSMLRPRFKLWFQFDPSSIRNPQFNASSSLQALVSIRPFFNPQFAFRNPQFNAAIGNSNNIREGLLRLAEIPDAQEEKEGDNRH